MWAGIGPDEGGYAYIADQWANGMPLYKGIWLDRPQGLMLLYQAVLAISDDAWGIRGAAVLAGTSITVMLGAIGWMLRGPATGIAAAFIYAVVGVGPHIEGFTLNGELAAAVPATAAVAATVAWWRTERWQWLLAAGALGGIAPLMKQSGFDGLVVAGLTPLLFPAPAVTRARRVLLVGAGAAIPLGAAALHALTIGWSRYWYALVSFKERENASGKLGGRWHLFTASLPHAEADLLAVAIVAVTGIALCLHRRRQLSLPVIWLAAAIGGLNIGGFFWPHYYLQLVAPLVLLAALGATAIRSRPFTMVLVCAALAPVMITLVQWGALPVRERLVKVDYARGYRKDQQLAGWIRAHTAPKDRIYLIGSRADIFFLAHRASAFPYLWNHTPISERMTVKRLTVVLASPHRPRLLVLIQRPEGFDRTLGVARVVKRFYKKVAKVLNTPIMGRRDDPQFSAIRH